LICQLLKPGGTFGSGFVSAFSEDAGLTRSDVPGGWGKGKDELLHDWHLPTLTPGSK
jgi:hypothetical protein